MSWNVVLCSQMQIHAAPLQVNPGCEKAAEGTLTNFADCTVQVVLMSGVRFFLLKGIKVARHPRKPAQ